MKQLLFVLGLAASFSASAAPAPTPARLELQPGDHVCLLGNALAERMQHDNHWETPQDRDHHREFLLLEG
jgi:hypothetical protein